MYNKSIRDTLVHTLEDGTTVERPEWSPQSIKRHLLLSGEYNSIFKTYEQYLYKSIIVRQAEEIVNSAGRVDEAKTKALLASLKSFSEYRVKTGSRRPSGSSRGSTRQRPDAAWYGRRPYKPIGLQWTQCTRLPWPATTRANRPST